MEWKDFVKKADTNGVPIMASPGRPAGYSPFQFDGGSFRRAEIPSRSMMVHEKPSGFVENVVKPVGGVVLGGVRGLKSVGEWLSRYIRNEVIRPTIGSIDW